jgi:hypothetical protein
LEAFRAAVELWGELLAKRQDPTAWHSRFVIALAIISEPSRFQRCFSQQSGPGHPQTTEKLKEDHGVRKAADWHP